MKNIILLGATGSIGTQTLDIIRTNKDKFRVLALSVGRDLDKSIKIIEEFKPLYVVLREKVEVSFSYSPKIYYGDSGLVTISKITGYDDILVVNALVGYVGLIPTYEAIMAGNNVALANKETLVMAGEIIMPLAFKMGVSLIPIDSEHSAILQCLSGENKKDVKSLIITASGGSFRDKSREELKDVTLVDALNHPNWSMGKKITIDSATMMNKGFEVIEAHYLFDMPYDKIKTILHRQSIVHSLVEFNDNSLKAVLASVDMKMPILYALAYPNHEKTEIKELNLESIGNLSFERLSKERFKCLDYAYKAGEKGGLYPCVLNAANEAAVSLFLDGKIEFLDIERIIEEELSKDYDLIDFSLKDIINLDRKIQTEIKNKFGGNK